MTETDVVRIGVGICGEAIGAYGRKVGAVLDPGYHGWVMLDDVSH